MANKVIHKWLKDQLDRLMRVQVSTLGKRDSIVSPAREVDVVVYLWGGIRVHVHILDEPTKPRIIKRILEDATNIGVATLFIINHELLPKHGERLTNPPEWLTDLHALTDKIYTYYVGANGPGLRVAYFVGDNRTAELEMRHGMEIGIEQLRYYQKTLRPKSIKGYWMVADFGTDVPPKRSTEQPNHSHAQAQQHSSQRHNAHQGQSHIPRNSQTGGQNNGWSYKQQVGGGNGRSNGYSRSPASPPPPKNRLDSSYELLGIDHKATREEVKAAFRKLAFELHPDVSSLPKPEAEARFKALSEAYEYIKTSNRW